MSTRRWWFRPGGGSDLEVVQTWSWFRPGGGSDLEVVLTWTWFSPEGGLDLKVVQTWTWFSPEGEGVLLSVDDISVLGPPAVRVFGVQLGVLGVLGAHWVGVVATAYQVERAGPVSTGLGGQGRQNQELFKGLGVAPYHQV